MTPLANLGRFMLFVVILTAASTSASVATTAGSVAQYEEPLGLGEVLDSAHRFHPLLQATRMEAEGRSEAARSAAGAFDTRLRANGELRPAGFYENGSGSVSLEQPTRLWGAEVYGRYRYGGGDFPSYEGGRLTDGSGEFAAGLRIPLLRGGPIDDRRADLRRAALDLASFPPEIQLERVSILRQASLAYWEWVAAGNVVHAMKALLSAAEARQAQIVRRADRGQQAAIDIDDNKRLVVERRARLRGAERDFRKATLGLSLFLRTANGEPLVVEAARLPRAFPEESPIDPESVEHDLQRARESHPELRRLSLEREKRQLEVELARNRILPDLSLDLQGSRDFGSSRPGIDVVGNLSAAPRSYTEARLQLRLELPVQLRGARGELGQARVRLQQLDRRIQFTRERIEADARMALASLSAALEQTSLARENVRLAEILRVAEVRKLGAGLSNLIDVNIREVQAASAAQELVEAQKEYFHALADYEARIVAFDG